MKVGFLGLDTSGKSAFLAGLREEYSAVLDTIPTESISKEIITILGQKIVIYDYGGEDIYRDQYLEDVKAHLSELELIYFIFDVTAPDRVAVGIEYLKNTLAALKSFDPFRVIICLHKVDPDIKDSSPIRQTITQIEASVQQIDKGIVTFEETSVFNTKSLYRAFAHGIQKIATKEDLLYDHLEKFTTETSAAGVLLLDNRAMAISSYVSDEDTDYVLESCVSFVDAWKSISIRQMMPGKLSIKVMKGEALFYPLNSPTGLLFLIVYSKTPETSKTLSDKLPSFIERIQDILETFFDK
ncbi:MAG: ADP-ribosylation factor-like protein [Promethearchaeota archaeon]